MLIQKPKCVIPDCGNNAFRRSLRSGGKYMELCSTHHKLKYGMSISGSRGRLSKKFHTGSCQLCGWIGPCDMHRLKPGHEGGKYEVGNVISICPNCHRLEHIATSKTRRATISLQEFLLSQEKKGMENERFRDTEGAAVVESNRN